VKGAFDSSSVVVTEVTDVLDDVCYLLTCNFDITKLSLLGRKPCFRSSTKIEHYFNEIANIFSCSELFRDLVREYVDECFEIVDDLCGGFCQFEFLLIS
jgi:hypothetical protein